LHKIFVNSFKNDYPTIKLIYLLIPLLKQISFGRSHRLIDEHSPIDLLLVANIDFHLGTNMTQRKRLKWTKA